MKPWRRVMWCIGKLTEEHRRRMYDSLALYAKPLRHDEPVICIDEKSLHLLGHSREPLPMAAHAPAKHDYEYKRNATARRVHLVLDNLNTHFRKFFDDVLGKRAAAKLLRRVQLH